MITVVELLQYIRRSDKLLTEDERRNIVNYLAIHPTAGDIMRGTGGIRKLRWNMNEAFESIKQGLTEAIEFAKGEGRQTAVVHEFSPIDVKAIRENVGMSQSEFAAAFGISLGTLRHWERGDRKPQGPALVLLNLVAREPELVIDVLSSAS